jgi:hypothetical protein
VWLSGSAVVFLLLAAQSIGGKYGPGVTDAWSWLLPLVSPMLLLIVGAVVAEAYKPRARATVSQFSFRLSFGLSLFYLILLAAAILVQPFSQQEPLKVLDVSTLWLGPLQGLVATSLGVFFQSKENSE